MTCRVRRLRDVDLELRPPLADGLEVGDRGGEQRGLRVLGLVEDVLGTLERESADGFAERRIGGFEHAPRRARAFGEEAGHPDGLAALAREDEGDLGHRQEIRLRARCRAWNPCRVARIYVTT